MEFMDLKNQQGQKIIGKEVLETISWGGVRWRSQLEILQIEIMQLPIKTKSGIMTVK